MMADTVDRYNKPPRKCAKAAVGAGAISYGLFDMLHLAAQPGIPGKPGAPEDAAVKNQRHTRAALDPHCSVPTATAFSWLRKPSRRP